MSKGIVVASGSCFGFLDPQKKRCFRCNKIIYVSKDCLEEVKKIHKKVKFICEDCLFV